MQFIYAETIGKSGGVSAKGVYSSYLEVALADKEARERGERVTGSLQVAIALNRYRANRCMNCGCTVGSNHKEGCRIDKIMEA